MTTRLSLWRAVQWTETLRKRSELGASLVEYALLMALIAIVCVAAVSSLGESLPGELDSATSGLTASE